MGGSSKTVETKKQAVQQPNVPTFALDPVQNLFAGVGNFQQADPYQFVEPVNDIQKAAFNNTGGLFGAGDIYGQAAQMAGKAGSGSPLTAAASHGGNAAFTAGGPVANAGAQGYNASSMMDGFNRYLDPTLGALVDTTLADFDANSARQKADQQARYAKAGAFGGSRSAIGEGLLDAELARARASTDAGLRSNAWNTAGQFAQFDATGRNAASQFGANASNQAALANAMAANQQTLAEMQQQNQMAMENARLTQDQSQFEALQKNAMALQQKQLELDSAKALAGIAGSGADTYRADLGAQLDAGNALYTLDSTARQAPITQLQVASGLLNPGLIDQVSGQTINEAGTEYTKTNPGLLNSVLGVASMALPFLGPVGAIGGAVAGKAAAKGG